MEKQVSKQSNDIILAKPLEFCKRFWKHLAAGGTHEDAYRKTEADYHAIFGENKYSSFESFKVVKNRQFKTR